MAVKRANGQRISGRIPYGWDLDTDGTTLIENPEEQAIIGEILDMRGKGMSYPKIAVALTGRAIPTKEGNSRWDQSSVRAIVLRHAKNGDTRP